MQLRFEKSLDRPLEIIGLKGKWITIALVGIGASALIGIIAGSMVDSGIGISVAVVLCIASVVGCNILQSKYSYRQVEKHILTPPVRYYVPKRETLCHVLLPKPEHKNEKKK